MCYLLIPQQFIHFTFENLFPLPESVADVTECGECRFTQPTINMHYMIMHAETPGGLSASSWDAESPGGLSASQEEHQ